MSSKSPKRELYAHFATMARALGHEHRLELIEHLGQGTCAVETLAEKTGLSFANVSQHLQHLRRAGLVVAERSGKHVLYRLKDGPVIEAIAALQRLAQHNMAEVREVVESYFHRIDSLEPVDAQILMARINDGTALVLDVRPEAEYQQGHLPGAVNIPVEMLDDALELPADREIVAYCRGPYCVLSFEAIQKLRAKGYNVRRYRDGFPEWKTAGLPVEMGN